MPADVSGMTDRIKRCIEAVVKEASLSSLVPSADSATTSPTTPQGHANDLSGEIALVTDEISSLRRSLKMARRRLSRLMSLANGAPSSAEHSVVASDREESVGPSKARPATGRGSILSFFSAVDRTPSDGDVVVFRPPAVVKGFADFQVSSTTKLAIRTLIDCTPDIRIAVRSDAVSGASLLDSLCSPLTHAKPGSESSSTRLDLKYFHFGQSLRPPYYGTWSKRSLVVGPLEPLARDVALVDYEMDSDEEWDVEGGDEVCSNDERSAEEMEAQENDGFFVPAGHLSADEMGDSDEGAQNDDAKTRFENWYLALSRARLRKLVPKCVGCCWQGSAEYEAVRDHLEPFRTWLITGDAALAEKDNTTTRYFKLTKGETSRPKRNASPRQKRRKITITPIASTP